MWPKWRASSTPLLFERPHASGAIKWYQTRVSRTQTLKCECLTLRRVSRKGTRLLAEGASKLYPVMTESKRYKSEMSSVPRTSKNSLKWSRKRKCLRMLRRSTLRNSVLLNWRFEPNSIRILHLRPKVKASQLRLKCQSEKVLLTLRWRLNRNSRRKSTGSLQRISKSWTFQASKTLSFLRIFQPTFKATVIESFQSL
jgi:hypothetical protein